MELAGIEGFGEFIDETIQIVFIRTHHRMTDHRTKLAVMTPVNEKSESKIPKPFETLGFVAGIGDGFHGGSKGLAQDEREKETGSDGFHGLNGFR
jgi:hypothetical protein